MERGPGLTGPVIRVSRWRCPIASAPKWVAGAANIGVVPDAARDACPYLAPRPVLLLRSEGQRVQAHSHQAFVSGRRGHDRGRPPGRCAGSAVLRSVTRAHKPARTGGDRRAGARSDRFRRFPVGRCRNWRGRGDRASRRGRRSGNDDPPPAYTPCCHSLTRPPGRGSPPGPNCQVGEWETVRGHGERGSGSAR